ncbi:MAG: IclR family transcriptional regulator [Dehalococcoidia bacterium]|jgi:DNA-binding IclR family transcriptional regulator
MSSDTKTVIKALDILEIFLKTDGLLSLKEISDSAKINLATTYRLVSTLVNRGYLSHLDNKGGYSLGIKMLDYNFAIRKNLKFIDFAYLSLSKLSKKQRASVYLAVKDNDESVVIEEVGIDEELRINSPVGKRLKIHCTAGGKILMTSLSKEERKGYYERNPLIPFTEKTITDIDQLENEIERARVEGVAFDNEEYRMGIWAAAAPIINSNGNVIATAGILIPKSRIRGQNTKRYATAIKSCVGEISQIVSRFM